MIENETRRIEEESQGIFKKTWKNEKWKSLMNKHQWWKRLWIVTTFLMKEKAKKTDTIII